VPPDEVQADMKDPTDVGAVHNYSPAEASSLPPPAQSAPVAGNEKGYGAGASSVLSEHLGEMMGDAPMCDTCGHITVRNGACYKCLNCGASMGCS
jgi:ribonucleoside-diphosphate reductase alpha chain